MKNRLTTGLVCLLFLLGASCSREEVPMDEGFKEMIPDTTIFTNAEFIYNGDDIGEGTSDGWVIRFHTDMEIDAAGAPVGPGSVMQLLLNARYSENQTADPYILAGSYGEMMNSMDFSPLTFVPGYMNTISLPGGSTLDFADATYYADVKEGSTEMYHDLLDEGGLDITANKDGTFTIEGVLVGRKYTKRYFTWTGDIIPEDNVPEENTNSTLKRDLKDLSFTKGQLQDKGDYFYLKDQSYRCFLLYLVDDTVDISLNRPTGTGAVLRLEVLVPWESSIDDGVPAGTYRIIPRNEDTSMDRDKIVPGGAVEGLPDVFAAWKLAGCWYYELLDGTWTDTYARISGGTITVERGSEGSHTIRYDLTDCQKKPKRIVGESVLNTLETY